MTIGKIKKIDSSGTIWSRSGRNGKNNPWVKSPLKDTIISCKKDYSIWKEIKQVMTVNTVIHVQRFFIILKKKTRKLCEDSTTMYYIFLGES